MLDFFTEKDYESDHIFVPRRDAPAPAHVRGQGGGLGWLGLAGISLEEYRQAIEARERDEENFEARMSPEFTRVATTAQQKADEKARRKLVKWVLLLAVVALVATAVCVTAIRKTAPHQTSNLAGNFGEAAGTTSSKVSKHSLHATATTETPSTTTTHATSATTAIPASSYALATSTTSTSAMSSSSSETSTTSPSWASPASALSATTTPESREGWPTARPNPFTYSTISYAPSAFVLPTFTTMYYTVITSPALYWPSGSTGTAPWSNCFSSCG